MDKPEEIVPEQPEKGPEESPLEVEDLENIAGGAARPLYAMTMSDTN